MAIGNSLFNAASEPVLPSATGWVTASLFGDIAVSLCVLAVAFVGFMLMTGRLALREGVRVAIGCFTLLSAPIIAAGLHTAAGDVDAVNSPKELIIETAPAPSPPPSASYDPYAGASLARD